MYSSSGVTMPGTTAIVIAHGALGEVAALHRRLAMLPRGTLVVAADGGARHARTLGLEVGLLVGDLDSLTADEREAFEAAGARLDVHPTDKDETDLELALLAACARADEIVVLAALGGRPDMALANVLLLADPRLAGARVAVWEGDHTLWLIRPPGDAIGARLGPAGAAPGDRLSLLPIGGPATGVTTKGLAYPLAGEALELGPARGVSNWVTDASAHVALQGGLLLAVHTPAGAVAAE